MKLIDYINKGREQRDVVKQIKKMIFTLSTTILMATLIILMFAGQSSAENNSSLDPFYFAGNTQLSLSRVHQNNDRSGYGLIKIELTDIGQNGMDFTDEYDLFVTLNSENGAASYKYSGSMIFPILYPVSYPGNYTFMLLRKNDNAILSSVSYSITTLSGVPDDLPINEIISGANITNNVTDNDSTDNDSDDIPGIISDNITDYVVDNATQDQDIVTESNITIIGPGKLICKDAKLSIDKGTYHVGENIIIKSEILGDGGLETGLQIVEEANVYKFVGTLSDINFIPPKPGKYTIEVECPELTGYIILEVIEAPINLSPSVKNVTPAIPIIPSIGGDYSVRQIIIRDSTGRQTAKEIKLKENRRERFGDVKIPDGISGGYENISHENPTYISDVPAISLDGLDGLDGSTLQLNSLAIQENETITLDIENVPTSKIVSGMPGTGSENISDQILGHVLTSYAMDLSNLNFTNGTFYKQAVGNELWKCKDWVYDAQTCLGTWTKIMDLVPGQYYSFEVSPVDPGYVEIIHISKAYHLDENRSLISDIYDEVRELDGIWSEPLYSGEYVRVTFEKALYNYNDITIYSRNVQGLNTYIEVYYPNSTDKITEFPLLLNETYYTIYLTTLVGELDTFDLHILNIENESAYIEIDHIIDPTIGLLYENWEDQNFAGWTNTGWAIASDRAQGTYSAKCATGANCEMNVTPALNTAIATQVNVTFSYNDDDCDGGDVIIYFKDSSGSWDDMGDIDAGSLGDSDDTWNTYTISTTDAQYMHSSFSVRFFADPDAGGGPNAENYWLDNINITLFYPDYRPNITLNVPSADYWNSTSSPVNVTFNCSITDDFKSQNISLYITTHLNTSFAFNDTCSIATQNGSCQWTKPLINGNYTWNCLGYDNESQSKWASVNRSILINYTPTPPSVSGIQCYKMGVGWTTCNNVLFGNTLEIIRTTCTSGGSGGVKNASFILKNINDNKVYFNVTTTDNSTGYWQYDIPDLTIYDSGDFNLKAICRENPEGEGDYNWTVPWGILNATLIYPDSDANVTQNYFFNLISNVTCLGGECGYIEATLDPTTAETADSGQVNDNDGGNDEEGGSYTDTQTNNGVYYAIGENTNGANDNVNSEIELYFNLTSLGMQPEDLNSLNVSVTYCYSGANTYGAIDCDGGSDAPEKTVNGAQDIWIFNYNTSTWIDIGDFVTTGGETERTDVYNPTGNLEQYISSNNLVGVRMEYVTNNGNNNDAWFATDYVSLIVNYTILKSGAVSTVVGALPFYTTSPNPQNNSYQSCLGNMTAGSSCANTWSVNATGEIGTVHEFFVIYNSTSYPLNVSAAQTRHINITIVNNTAPYVAYVNLTPQMPGLSDNLNCSFLVSDSSVGTLSATVYWYESGVSQYNQTINVSNGIEASVILGSGNTSASDVWHCGVRPYDQSLYGLQVNSSNVTILASNPPIISNIECQRFGVVWGSCSNVAFNDQFTGVRATCTDPDGYVLDVNFTFYNVEDSYTYFSQNYTNLSGNVFTLDFSDIAIEDSGNFDLTVACIDNTSVSASSVVSWPIPWGTLSSILINPSSAVNVTQYKFFNFTSRVTCTGGECGNINATLDPIPPWWNGHYLYRTKLNVTNNAGSTLQVGYTVNFTINTSSSKFLDNGNDLRIVWRNGTSWQELDRINETTPFDSDTTMIWFKTQQSISAGSSDSNYYVYYGYASAGSAPTNRSKVYLYFDDFNRPDNSDITAEAAYGQTGGGTWSISGNKLVNVGAAGDPNKLEIDVLGDVNYDVDMWTKINIYSTLGSSSDLWRMGLSSNIDDVGGDGRGYCLLLHEDHSSLDMLNDLRSWGTYGSYSWNVDTWYNMRFRVIDPSSNTGYGKVWTVGTSEPSSWTINGGNFGGGTVRGYGELGFGGSRQGDTTYFDDIIIRYIVADEPTISLLSEESYGYSKGVIPMNSGDPFYTITSNPMYYTTTSCLANMTSGDTCDTQWEVYANGTINSTWEFFTIYSSNYSGVTANTTHRVNITIIQNTAPSVFTISLSPTQPLFYDDLYCNFTVIDSSISDVLTVNVTWYLNNAFYSSSVQSTSNGVGDYDILSNTVTSAGQVWHCGVRPYDQSLYGAQVNSSNVTILQNIPPSINNIECMENNLWTSCSNLSFNEVLQGVRANCTSIDGRITNATFVFSNTPDSSTYYSQTVYSNISNNWPYFQNVTLNNSGEFRIDVYCADNNSQVSYKNVTWTLPWGVINMTLINPYEDSFVERNKFFNFTAQLQCVGGECGDVTVILDPISGSSPAIGTPDSGYVIDNPGNDEEGGSYVQTQTYNGPQTAAPGTAYYYIIGEGDTANTALSYIVLRYNLSSLDMVPEDINSLTFNLSYCHSGEDDVNQDFCDNDAPMEKTADGAQNAEVYDFVNAVWVDIGDITVHANEALYNESYTATGTLANYVNSTSKDLLVRYEADFSDTGGDGFLAIDYATVTVNFTKLKRGAVSTIPGTLPFYTTSPNPTNYSYVSCLKNMIAGSSACELSWMVNATGDLYSTHEFFVIYEMDTNQAYVSDGESIHINITISDSSLIPPVVTLIYPPHNYNLNFATVNLTCGATDNSGLQNISLYGNFSGSFVFNSSASLSGTSQNYTFTKTLPEGRYLWNCVAFDTDGNSDWADTNRSFTVDLTSPNVTLNAPDVNQYFSAANINFNITASDTIDAVLSCNLTVDSIVVEQFITNSGQPKIVTENLSQGTHYWNVTCYDDAGNYNTSVTRNFTISDIGPSVVLITANNIYQQSSFITLQYLPSDNNGISYANLIINGTIYDTDDAVTNNALNAFAINIGEGYYTWTINVSDVSNLTAQAAVRYFTIDNTTPIINLTWPPDNFSTNQSSIAFNFTVRDNVDTSLVCDLLIDGVVEDNDFSAANGGNISRTISGIEDGIHYWNVTCIDDSGNHGYSQTFMLNVSNAPFVSLDNPPDNASFNYNNPILYYTANDNLNISNCTLILDDQINQTDTSVLNGVQSSFELESLSQGYHNWTVSCYDVSGLPSNIPQKRTFLIDLTVPSISLHSPVSAQYNGTIITFNYTASDNFDTMLMCNFTLDGQINVTNIASPNSTPANFTVNIVNEGIHYWNITCYDDAGNYNTSATWNFTNLVPPTVTLSAPIPGALLNYSQNIEFIYQPYDNQGLSNTTLYINGLYNVSDSSPTNGAINSFFVNFSTDGFYYWQINATDTIGLMGGSETRNLTIDTSPPIIGIMTPIEDQVISWNYVNFTFNVTDNLIADIICNVTVDGIPELVNVPVPSGSINVSFKTLYDGPHNWSVTCIDTVGWMAYSGVINFTVDAPPGITLNSPIDNFRTKSGNILFNYTPQDAIGIENCSLYINGTYNQSDSFIEHNQFNYFNISGMTDGDYSWTVECTDEAPDLNSYTAPAENFSIDNQGPIIILNYPPESQAINENDVTFNWTGYDYPGTLLYCNLTIDGVMNVTGLSNYSGVDFLNTVYGLSDGPHTWLIQCADDLGNPSSSGTGNFTINQPDLFIDTSRIIFNDSNPDMNETINITANVSNIGGVPASNVFVEFWDGIPEIGLYIGNATGAVNTNSSTLFSVLWNITYGYHSIYVVVDPSNTVGELNESNNNATRNISVLSANITAPLNNSRFTNPNISINFTLQDFTGGLINYSVFVDNIYSGQSGTVTDGVASNATAPLNQGRHSIKIEASDYLGRRKNSTEIFVTIDSIAPYPVINTANDTWFNYGTPQINISAIDNISQNLTYKIFVNGSLDIQGNIANGTSIVVNLTALPNGTYIIVMEASDELNNSRNSTPKTIHVDTVNPQAYIMTSNGTWFNTSTPRISVNLTDNMAPTIQYISYVDGLYNSNGSVQNGTHANITLAVLPDGVHMLIVEGRDLAGNSQNSTQIQIYVDTARPAINLNHPANDTNLTFASTELNFTAIDNLATYLNCTVLLDGAPVANLNVSNNTETSFAVNGLAGGYHYWNVTCRDIASNSNTSLTYRFFVVLPDIFINSSFIYLDVASLVENDTVNITAEIRNIGQNDAHNFTVEIRLGSITGSLLGSFMMNLTMDESKNVTVSYALPIGDSVFNVLADVPISTNGTVYESNESNNNASKTLTVGSWQYVLGYQNGRLAVQDPDYSTMFDWIVQNATGGNVFAADSDSNINWLNLTALSRNTSDQFVLGDFNVLDRRLGMENNSDSINTTYTSSGQPKGLSNVTIFNRQVNNIPSFNSTNNSNFFTGILWDSGDGGMAFNASQDVLFITKINMNVSGYNGTYDFELRVPAKLRTYKGGTDAVALYAELN